MIFLTRSVKGLLFKIVKIFGISSWKAAIENSEHFATHMLGHEGN